MIEKEDSIIYTSEYYNFSFTLPKTISFTTDVNIDIKEVDAGRIIGVFLPHKDFYRTRDGYIEPFVVFLTIKEFQQPVNNGDFINIFQDLSRQLCLQTYCRKNFEFSTKVNEQGFIWYRSIFPKGSKYLLPKSDILAWGFPLKKEGTNDITGIALLIPQRDHLVAFDSLSFDRPMNQISDAFRYLDFSVDSAIQKGQTTPPSWTVLPDKYKVAGARGDLLYYQNSDMGIAFWYPKHLEISSKEYYVDLQILWPETKNLYGDDVQPALSFAVDSDRSGIVHSLAPRCIEAVHTELSQCLTLEENQITIRTNKNSVNYGIFYAKSIHDSEQQKTVETERLGPFVFVPLAEPQYLVFFPVFYFSEYPADIIDAIDKDFSIIMDTLKFIPFTEAGIGIIFSKTDEGMKIDNVLENTPADIAGLKSQDLILKIGNVVINNFPSADEAAKLITGKAGTEITLLIQREGDVNPQEVRLTLALLNIANSGNKITEKLKEITIAFKSPLSWYMEAHNRDEGIPFPPHAISLHIYTSSGLHAGMNPQGTKFENQISGISIHGNNFEQFVSIKTDIAPEDVKFVVEALDLQKRFEEDPASSWMSLAFWNSLVDKSDSYEISYYYTTNWNLYNDISSLEGRIKEGQKIIYRFYYSDKGFQLRQVAD